MSNRIYDWRWEWCTDKESGHSVLMAERNGVWRLGYDKPKPQGSSDPFDELPIRLPDDFFEEITHGWTGSTGPTYSMVARELLRVYAH